MLSKLTENRKPQTENGLTLLELLAALALLALLLGLVAPGWFRGWEKERGRAALRDLAATLRLARSTAATQRRPVRVFLDLTAGTYRLEGSTRGGEWPLGLAPADARLVWQESPRRRGYIAFYADGSSSGGFLALRDPSGRTHRLEVEIITGRVWMKSRS